MSRLGAFCESQLGGFIESRMGARGCGIRKADFNTYVMVVLDESSSYRAELSGGFSGLQLLQARIEQWGILSDALRNNTVPPIGFGLADNRTFTQEVRTGFIWPRGFTQFFGDPPLTLDTANTIISYQNSELSKVFPGPGRHVLDVHKSIARPLTEADELDRQVNLEDFIEVAEQMIQGRTVEQFHVLWDDSGSITGAQIQPGLTQFEDWLATGYPGATYRSDSIEQLGLSLVQIEDAPFGVESEEWIGAMYLVTLLATNRLVSVNP